MLEVAVAHFVTRKFVTHEMTLKLLQNGLRAWKTTPLWLDEASCVVFDVGNAKRRK